MQANKHPPGSKKGTLPFFRMGSKKGTLPFFRMRSHAGAWERAQ